MYPHLTVYKQMTDIKLLVLHLNTLTILQWANKCDQALLKNVNNKLSIYKSCI